MIGSPRSVNPSISCSGALASRHDLGLRRPASRLDTQLTRRPTNTVAGTLVPDSVAAMGSTDPSEARASGGGTDWLSWGTLNETSFLNWKPERVAHPNVERRVTQSNGKSNSFAGRHLERGCPRDADQFEYTHRLRPDAGFRLAFEADRDGRIDPLPIVGRTNPPSPRAPEPAAPGANRKMSPL